MIRIPGVLAFSLLALSSSGAGFNVAAQETDDLFYKMTGEWIAPGAVTSVTIKDNHVVEHFRMGRGDIRHSNADYYDIQFRGRSMTCHYQVRVPSATELSMLRWDNQDPAECDLGELRRARYVEGAPGAVSEIWEQIKGSADVKDFEAFRRQFGAKYPDYDAQAKKRLTELRPPAPVPVKGDTAPPAEDDISTIIARHDNQGRSLSITPESPVYRVGDVANFTVVSSQGCFLTLLSQDDRAKEATVIFPNKFQQINWLPGGTPVTLPGADAPFVFRLKDRGIETVIAVCADKNVPVDGISHDFNRSEFTSVPDYAKAVSRSIEVQRKSAENYQRPSNPQPAQAIVWRSVIKVQVR